MSEPVTTDLILDTLKTWVEERQPISPERWLDSAGKLNVLVGEDMAQLALKEFELAKIELEMTTKEPKLSVAMIKLHSRANPLSLEIALLRGKIKRIEESIKISKKQATMSNDEYKH